jgi:hypothetical protein
MRVHAVCIIVFVIGFLPLANAQSISQPMLGTNWSTHVILFSTPDSPAWARDAILRALDDWNMAQIWFTANYFPNQNNAVYTLTTTENDSGTQVTVKYVADTGQSWTGITQTALSGTIHNATVSIVLSRLQTPKDLLQAVEHELGHVLGLDHTNISYDLMYPAQSAYSGGITSHPSTLNLYGVYLLATGCRFASGDTVTLPPQIPFIEWYPDKQLTNPIVTSSKTETKISDAALSTGQTCPLQSVKTIGFSVETHLVATGIVGVAALLLAAWRRGKQPSSVKSKTVSVTGLFDTTR